MPVHRESHGLAVAAPMHPTALGIAAGQRCRRARGMAVRQRIARQRVGVVPTAERLWPVDQADLAPTDRDQERVVVRPSVGWGAEPGRYCYGALIGPWLTLKSGASEIRSIGDRDHLGVTDLLAAAADRSSRQPVSGDPQSAIL
jgi:hypothetical protein